MINRPAKTGFYHFIQNFYNNGIDLQDDRSYYSFMNKLTSKKDQILWAGLEIMKTHGYNGTSVKDIVDAAGVPKGSFYNYFDSKESFAVEALEAVASEDQIKMRQLLSGTEGTPLQRLKNLFEQTSSNACACDFKVGCFFGNMGQEMADSNEIIRHKVKQILKRNTQLFADVLNEAKEAGEIKSTADTAVMAEFIMNAWEGTLLRMKASKSRTPLDAFLDMLPQIAN
jgi:TetR/AcrR family transcriptional repressor of nem operon